MRHGESNKLQVVTEVLSVTEKIGIHSEDACCLILATCPAFGEIQDGFQQKSSETLLEVFFRQVAEEARV